MNSGGRLLCSISRRLGAGSYVQRPIRWRTGYSSGLAAVALRSYSSSTSQQKGKGNRNVPDEFFDDEVEADKEFLEIAAALKSDGGLKSITTVTAGISWAEVEAARSESLDAEIDEEALDATFDSYSTAKHDFQFPFGKDMSEFSEDDMKVFNSLKTPDLAEHLKHVPPGILPQGALNMNMPIRKADDPERAMLANFMLPESAELYKPNEQDERPCPGKLQRRGKNPVLQCHKIDLDDLSYLDVLTLQRYLTDDSEIMGKKLTGLCARCQRKVAKTIKRARNFGLLPHIGEMVVQDARPSGNKNIFSLDSAASDSEHNIGKGVLPFHDIVPGGHNYKGSKTVL